MALVDDMAAAVAPDDPADYTLKMKASPGALVRMIWRTAGGKVLHLLARGDYVDLRQGGTNTELSAYNKDHAEVTALYASKEVDDTGF